MAKAMDSALRLLAEREHSALELCNKLQHKGFSIQESQEALASCQDLGLQSDSRFVELYLHSRIARGYGPLKIRQELKNKGINPELIEQKLNEEENWHAHAKKVWQKKTKNRTPLTPGDLQKQHRFLLYRGFSMDVIARVVKDEEF
jgi:regulatory protein